MLNKCYLILLHCHQVWSSKWTNGPDPDGGRGLSLPGGLAPSPPPPRPHPIKAKARRLSSTSPGTASPTFRVPSLSPSLLGAFPRQQGLLTPSPTHTHSHSQFSQLDGKGHVAQGLGLGWAHFCSPCWGAAHWGATNAVPDPRRGWMPALPLARTPWDCEARDVPWSPRRVQRGQSAEAKLGRMEGRGWETPRRAPGVLTPAFQKALQ